MDLTLDPTPDSPPPTRPQRRDPALVPLSHDHNRGLARAREVVLVLDGAQSLPLPTLAERVLDFVAAELAGHFGREEVFLAPCLLSQAANTGGPELAERMCAEHRALERHVDAIRQTHGDGDQPGLTVALRAWSEALTAHIRFEERELFGHLQQTLGAGEMAALGACLIDTNADDGDVARACAIPPTEPDGA